METEGGIYLRWHLREILQNPYFWKLSMISKFQKGVLRLEGTNCLLKFKKNKKEWKEKNCPCIWGMKDFSKFRQSAQL